MIPAPRRKSAPPEQLRRGAAAIAMAALALGSCGGGAEPSTTGVVEAATVERGSLRCEVRLLGAAPDLPIVVPDKNVEHCGAALADPVLLAPSGGVANAVVWLLDPPSVDAGRASELELGSKGCLLQPRIQSAGVGSTLALRNSDSITHNPHGWLGSHDGRPAGDRTIFNVTLIDEGDEVRRPLRRPGVYRIDCDTHSWMRAFVHVFDHPFHGVSDEAGVVVLQDLPVGRHELGIWHEVLGERRLTVDVVAGMEASAELTFDLVDRRPDALTPPGMQPWIERDRPDAEPERTP